MTFKDSITTSRFENGLDLVRHYSDDPTTAYFRYNIGHAHASRPGVVNALALVLQEDLESADVFAGDVATCIFTQNLDDLASVLKNPDFSRLEDIEPQYSEPCSFQKALLGDHPLAQDPSGDPDLVSQITPQILETFYRSHYGADNAVLFMTGQPHDAVSFASLPQTQETLTPYYPSIQPLEHRIRAKTYEEPYIRLGIRLSQGHNPFELELLNETLNSLLISHDNNVFQDHSVASHLEYDDIGGYIEIEGATRIPSLDAAEHIFGWMQALAPSQHYLEQQVEIIQEVIQEQLSETDHILYWMERYHDEGITPESYIEQLGEVTPTQIKTLAEILPHKDGKYVLFHGP